MTLLHLIRPDGTYDSQNWKGELEYACPPFAQMKELLGVREVEHVNVLWLGRQAHMFVDEFGMLTGKPPEVNFRASRIYANATLLRLGRAELLYDNLEILPTQIIQVGDDPCIIAGPALLWEGEME